MTAKSPIRTATMKAVVYHQYGSPGTLTIEPVDKPVPKDDEVLVRVRAASINPYDWHFLTGKPFVMRFQFGFRKPPMDRLGADLAGQVESVGRQVTTFKPGDAVFGKVNGETLAKPMLELASLAEYVCVSEDFLQPMPDDLTYEQAAAAPVAAITALQGLRDYGEVGSGHEVLINGASGGVGTFAVQIAKAFGADVTGVCSTGNVEMVRSLGADRVIDYTKEDFTRSGKRFDVMLDNVGNRSLSECRRVLTRGGMYLASFGRPENEWLGPFRQLIGDAPAGAVRQPKVRRARPALQPRRPPFREGTDRGWQSQVRRRPDVSPG